MPVANGRYEVITVRPSHRGAAMWPFDVALAIISGLVLVIVLRYLKFDDPRPSRNAWAYLIAIPGIMIVSSMILRLFASRMVERTLQISFLISVALHLLLAVGALNVFLFTRYWPDVYQSVTFETAPKKVVVPSYFKPASPAQAKPEYLRPVATLSEATVVDPKVARQEVDAATPMADMAVDNSRDRAPDPFLAPLPKPSPAEPEIASAATSLDREQLAKETPRGMSRVDLPDLDPNVASMPELEAPKTDVQRSDQPSRELPTARAEAIEERMEPKLPSTPLQAARAQSNQLPELPESQSASLERKEIARDETVAAKTVPQVESRVEPKPEVTLEARNLPERAAQSAATAATVNPSITQPDEQNPVPQAASELVRAPSSRLPVDAMPGDVRKELSRETAGGEAAMAPQNLATMQGPKRFESRITAENQPNPSTALPEARTDSRRMTHRDTTPSSIAINASDSRVNDEFVQTMEATTRNLPEGLSRAKGNIEGPAIESNRAGSLGADGPQVRSRMSPSGAQTDGANGDAPRDQVGQRSVPVPTISQEPGGSTARSLEASQSDLSRNAKAGGRDVGLSPSLQGVSNELDSSTPRLSVEGASQPRLDRARTGQEPSIDRQGEVERRGRADSPAEQGAERGGLEGAVRQQVPVPTVTNETGPEGGKDAMIGPATDAKEGRTRSSSKVDGSNSLDPMVANDSEANTTTLRLPELDRGASDRGRREVMLPDVREGDLQTQRFRREEVGGPTLAGQGKPVPTPAFQRRMDRSSDLSDESKTGPLGPEVEQTIERGLAFLAARQRPDGSWHLEDFDTQVQIRSHTAATALALLAFQGAGYTHQSEKYASNVGKALQYLVKNQRPNGDLYLRMDTESDTNAWLYSHSIAALALSEAYGMTTDPELQAAAQRGVDFMVSTQDRKLGGWRYVPNNGSDTSVTGWFMMALKSAQLAGLDVKPDVFVGIKKWLDRNQASTVEPHLYRYNSEAPNTPMQQHGRLPTPIMTSIGMLSRLYMGWKRQDKPMQDAADYLLDFPPAVGTPQRPLRDTYYWYYATQFFFHMGGDHWREWNGKLQPLLVESQVLDGEMRGSWEPLGDTPDAWGRFGGRLYVTTLNLLSLEVYYRHLPLYDATGRSELSK